MVHHQPSQSSLSRQLLHLRANVAGVPPARAQDEVVERRVDTRRIELRQAGGRAGKRRRQWRAGRQASTP
eukprot:1566108-Prymnesium_polylepis.1